MRIVKAIIGGNDQNSKQVIKYIVKSLENNRDTLSNIHLSYPFDILYVDINLHPTHVTQSIKAMLKDDAISLFRSQSRDVEYILSNITNIMKLNLANPQRYTVIIVKHHIFYTIILKEEYRNITIYSVDINIGHDICRSCGTEVTIRCNKCEEIGYCNTLCRDEDKEEHSRVCDIYKDIDND